MDTSSVRVRLLGALAAAVLSVTIGVTITAASGAAASTATTSAIRPVAAKPTSKPTTNSTTTTATNTTTVWTSAPTMTTTASAATCTTPVVYGGQSYCPGYVVGVKNGAYGVGARILLRSVTVVGVAGSSLTVEGGPSCLPGAICGAIIPTVTASFAGLGVVPRYGDVIELYGITGTNTITATGYVFIRHCDPDFGC